MPLRHGRREPCYRYVRLSAQFAVETIDLGRAWEGAEQALRGSRAVGDDENLVAVGHLRHLRIDHRGEHECAHRFVDPTHSWFRDYHRPGAGPHRLAVQFAALSRLKHGFESRWVHSSRGSY